MSSNMNECMECGACIKICELLQEIGETPAMMTRRGVLAGQAFSCSLCGACETVCPSGLSPKRLFAERRKTAVQNGELDINEYNYLCPDRKCNAMSLYRRRYGIDYKDMEVDGSTNTVFFPGCTLLTYSPGITRDIYNRLKKNCRCQGLWDGCCGKPLSQLGLQQRFEDMQQSLAGFAKQHSIKKVITACPGCYYELTPLLAPLEIDVVTVYEMVDFRPHSVADKKVCAIHDACPDRMAGIFGRQVRQTLAKCGFSIVEMKHTKERTICCGSGGQLSHFRPDLAEKLVRIRGDEARESRADVLVGYCLSCVLKFDDSSTDIPVAHALNLLLEQPEDFKGAKAKAAQLFMGADGEKLWQEIMADE